MDSIPKYGRTECTLFGDPRMTCGVESVKIVIVVSSARPMLKVVHKAKPTSMMTANI